jgi:N-acetylneuraminate synthase
MEFTPSQWAEVKQHCEGVGLKFLASAFSVEAVRLLNDIGCETYKIGSGDLTNLLMIDQILKVAQEIIISTGLSTDQEVAKVVDRLQKASVPFALLHCTSEYPTPPRHMNLQMITHWMSQVSCPVGLSDHSATIYAGLAAVALGASLIEVHATFDRRMFGPDSTSSLSINEVAMLADGIKWLVASRSEVSPHKSETWHVMRDLFGRSLAAAQDLKVGQSLEADHLEAKKPSGFGIPASEYESVIGKKLTRDIPKGHFITIDAVSSS